MKLKALAFDTGGTVLHWHGGLAAQARRLSGLDRWGDAERETLWRSWRRLYNWADFAPALARLRRALPVVSFTCRPPAWWWTCRVATASIGTRSFPAR